MQKRGISSTNIPKFRAMWVEVGKDSQTCPWLHVIGKRDDKPMSYVAALHLVPNQNYVHNYYGPYAYCSLDKGVAYTRGGGSY